MAIAVSQLALAMGLSIILIAFIIACANFIHWFGRQQAIRRAESQPFSFGDLIVPPKHFILLRVLLDKNGHASLSTFQLLLWTLLIAFIYITLWFLHLQPENAGAPPVIPESILALMGISVGVPILNKGIMSYKELRARPEGETYTEPNYASMLEENNQPSLLRLQMFLWTIAAVVLYFWSFMTSALSATTTPATLVLTDIDPTLLFLMGLSQTGYLGSKAYSGTVKKEEPVTKVPSAHPAAPAAGVETGPARTPLAIRETVPRTVRPGELVTLLGSGFGNNKDTLILGEERLAADLIGRWEDTRIEFTLPETVPPGKFPVRVIVEGRTAEYQINVTGTVWKRGLDEIPADIVSDIWIDDPTQKGYRLPPIGHFIPDKRYYFFFEFAVPPGTPSWGRTQFKAEFYINNEKVAGRSFMPGYMNGNNYGVFDYTFTEEKDYTIAIRGATAKTMNVVVKRPAGTQG